VLAARASGRIGAPHLSAFDEFGAPAAVRGALGAGTIIVNSRFAPSISAVDPALKPGEALVHGGEIAAVALKASIEASQLADGQRRLADLSDASARPVDGWWLEESWDFVRTLPEMLGADATVLAGEIGATALKGTSVLGEHPVAVAGGAFIEPHVVFDTTAGAVVVMEGARVGAFARIAGPAVIGAHSQLAGGRYSGVSIGENCRACGEMSVVIMTSHANKGHDGFVGHSILGCWTNLGAGTTTSNLKNSYGPVRVTDSRGDHETGMQFIGSLIGDHAKTAILTALNTGTVVGAGANVFGGRGPGAHVAPFSWGTDAPEARYEKEKFLDVATHVMHRRSVGMSDGMRAVLGAAWDASR
jgi:UDP-N-acetylglucosamine diphosphorylase/glucosamine-1-phosphate N-acetyltransferase